MHDIFYRNPRLLQLVLALIVAGGVSSYTVLPRTEDPRLTKRNSLIQTAFPGASAEQVEALVTEKLEKRLEEIEEINKLDSTSRTGASVIRIELRDDVSEAKVNEVWSRIRDKIGDAIVDLPPGALTPKFNERDTEVDAYTVIAAFTWESPADAVDRPHDIYRSGVGYPIMGRLAETLADRLRAINGTKQTKVVGAPQEEILVKVSHQRLADLGLTAADVSRRIQQGDSKAPAGSLRGATNDLLLEIEGELDSLDRVRNMPIVSGRDGRVVRLVDLGRVEKTVADPPSQLAIVNGKPAVMVAARMETGQRIDRWSEQIRREINEFHSLTPSEIELRILFDQSAYVEERLNGLEANLMMAVALVMSVVWFTMGWRSALLVGAALPISALMALTGMRFFGLPIHQMSVTGLIVALGLLIDNAIVMVDEVRRRLDDGEPRIRAVGDSVRHLAVPLLGSTLTSVFAFLPIALLPGGGGEFVGPIAISVIIALLCSLFAALTIIPALTGVFATDRVADERRGAWWRDGFTDDDLGERYRSLLRKAFARPGLAILLAVATPIVGFMLQPRLQEQFFPPADRNQIQLQLRLPQQASINETLAYAVRTRELLIRHEQIEDVHWVVGGNAPKFYYNMLGGDEGSPFYAQALVSLRDNRGYFRFIRQIQEELDEAFPGAQILALQLEQGPPFEAPIELHLTGPDLDVLRELGEKIRAEVALTEGVTHVFTTLQDGKPKLHLKVDDEELRLAGIDNLTAAQQLQGALDGRVGGSLLESTEELPVRVRLDNADRGELARLASLDLMAGPNRVPLEAVVSVLLEPELAGIPHKQGQRVNTIRGYTQSGLLPSVALAKLEERLAAANIDLPPGYGYTFGGEAEQRNDAVGDLMANVSLLIILMASTLVLSFNSFRMAGVIGGVAALSMGFAFVMLWIFQYPFGFVAIVGSMGLIGVAVNDSIVVLAALREDSGVMRGDGEAAVAVVARATRHVVTTTATTMIGFSPLLFNGGEFWPPLAISLGAGVVGATVLALFFVPSALLLLNRRAAAAEASAGEPATT
jgi:multidrug efflux pump